MSVKRLLLKQSVKGGSGGIATLPIGLIFVWTGTLASIPTGFSLCDGSGGTPDLRSSFVEAVPDAVTNPGAIGGATTHSHISFNTFTHLATAHGNAGYQGDASAGAFRNAANINFNHTHNNIVGEGGQPKYYEVAYIMITGVVTQIPDGIIGVWVGALAAIPADWDLCDGAGGRPDLFDRFVKGTAAGINPGVVGGSNATHTHTTNVAAGSHNHLRLKTGATSTAYYGTADMSHSHSLQAAFSLPKYYTVAYLRKNGAGLPPSNIIAMWSGLLVNIPAGWVLCDGLGGRPNLLDRFVLGVPDAVTDPGVTGGADTHTHVITSAGAHTHPSSGFVDVVSGGAVILNNSAGNHTHTFAVGDNHPPFYQLAFIIKT